MTMDPAREEMLGRVRAALNRSADSGVAPISVTARIPPRVPGSPAAELDLFLSEVEKLGGKTKRLKNQADLIIALCELLQAESIKKVTMWQTPELKGWGIEKAVRSTGVEIISPYESNRKVAESGLGITGADFALPETGTLVLRSSDEKPRTVSLLPAVHLAIVRPSSLRPDLHQVLDELKQDGYMIFVTGPSRTSDIELTTTVGVHGPKTLYVWVMPD